MQKMAEWLSVMDDSPIAWMATGFVMWLIYEVVASVFDLATVV